MTQLTSYSHNIIEAHPRGAATTSITNTTLSAQGIVTPPSSPSNSLSAGEAPSSTSLSAAVSTSSPPDAREFYQLKKLELSLSLLSLLVTTLLAARWQRNSGLLVHLR